jgi:hypothetical protein
MLNFSKFTKEEDEFLTLGIIEHKVSRLAFKLKRPYFMVEQHCVALGLIRKPRETRFISDDEVEFNLLFSGCTEEEIRELRGSKTVYTSELL